MVLNRYLTNEVITMTRQIKIIVDDIDEVPDEIIFVKPHSLGVYEYVYTVTHCKSITHKEE